MKIEEHRILHIGSFEKEGFETDEEVKMEVDMAPRKLNARIHSAGHLLDVGMRKLGF